MPTILIVDDSALFRESLIDILISQFGDLNIIEIDTENEAYARVDASLPDLILMDVSISSARYCSNNGMGITRNIKNRHPQIPVMILTSYDLPEYSEAALQSGAEHFISKDIASEDLLALVETILYKGNP